MNSEKTEKSTVEEIRARFDADVERFSNLSIGQEAAMDSALCMELIADAAAAVTPRASAVLDIGCGAGNYTLMLLQRLRGLNCTLLDLSQPMLERASERVDAFGAGSVSVIQADVRDADFEAGSFDIILAAAVLHHLRSDEEWREVFTKLYQWLRPGGAIWIYDMTRAAIHQLDALKQERYSAYLMGLQGEEYRDKVFAYIEKEDTPHSLPFQLDLLREVGFSAVEVLHKNGPFAAFGAMK
ncbi:class I SAM-dependent methyltransferase [Rubellicoccus peritrichatus]|uniref:Class I SAM-dependent methyltransferase n=1 Tax=Rubellicoccus peritrichatus TaxID=3080537 RepID=A0AAQ3LBK5_9BACT|nr:class I SAM-dependent methyltransferase [Puniceicoccus sp. CR14]WOO42401.1 class I SAM-dependent methyltransferase [Puniceicoccus sp. CR14]